MLVVMHKQVKCCLSAVSLLSIAVAAFDAKATPMISASGKKRLEQPGLWLSVVQWVQPQTGQAGQVSFRVYCPAAMMRDVSNGGWGKAATLKTMEGKGYPTGLVRVAYQQACEN